MFTADQYELVDFGNGRKLERFGRYLLNRPCPAAENHTPTSADGWGDADAVYQLNRQQGENGSWIESKLPDEWQIQHGDVSFRLRPTPFGHVGVFPEQAANWDWIAKQIKKGSPAIKVLNLFAYTGGSTLAAAAAGAQVAHVDSAKNTVAWARQNAEAGGLQDAPIRWIVEDASLFVQREVKRGNQYDAIILDPPSYGHGPKGETWKLTESLAELLRGCKELTRENRRFVLLTCHSPGFGPAEAEAILAQTFFGHCGAGATAKQIYLQTADGRRLNAGVAARWP